MLLGQVFQSVGAWRKLSAVNLKPKIAYAILKYTKLVSEEHAIAEKQRVMLIHEITKTNEGEKASIEPDTPEFMEYISGLNEIMSQESSLKKIDINMDVVIDALDGKDDVLSVSDLAMLEPFFAAKE
jgi:hypothetical protein